VGREKTMRTGDWSEKGRIGRLLVVAGWLAALGTVVASFGPATWLAELTSHFRAQYVAVLTVAAVVLASGRRRGGAALFGALALANVTAIYPLYVPEPVHVDPPVAPLRAMLSNVHGRNERYDLVLDAVRRNDPDLVVLLEVDARWLERLAALGQSHPYSIREPRDDNFGIALYSKHPLDDAQVTYHGIVPSLTADVRTGSAPLHVVATHPISPVAGLYARLRNSHLRELALAMRDAPRPAVLIGDLNVTPWSVHFARLLEVAGLEDSMRGFGLQSSWPAGIWPARLPIDHCLYTSGVRVVDRRLGPYVGSDHYPVIVDLEVGSRAIASSATSALPK
jgi:endonuclease/exonuclease/phosphatase (EEP) superfamily protein YafD